MTTQRPRRARRAPISAALAATALLALPLGTLAAGASTTDLNDGTSGSTATLEDTELAQLHDQLAALDARNTELTDENTRLTDANGTLEADNSQLQKTIDQVTQERDRLRDSLVRFADLYDPLEADRKLLTEMRKDLPDTRGEAEAHLRRLESLALQADPASLGQAVDRLDESTTDFLDWRFTQYGTTQEATEAYISSGANAFDSNMDAFRDAVLLSVANRLDGLLTILDRAR